MLIQLIFILFIFIYNTSSIKHITPLPSEGEGQEPRFAWRGGGALFLYNTPPNTHNTPTSIRFAAAAHAIAAVSPQPFAHQSKRQDLLRICVW